MAARGWECTLVDYSEQALDLARAEFTRRGLRARFIRCDMRNLALRNEQFDVVFSGGVLEFFDQLERPVDEMTRVLAPSGLLAAQMVPQKFSIQTIADLERTVAYSARHLLRGRIRDALRRTRMVPPEYGVSARALEVYAAAFQRAGLTSTVARVTGPFPALALPRVIHRRYARAMTALAPYWRAFDESAAHWTRVWGISYTVHGRKAASGS